MNVQENYEQWLKDFADDQGDRSRAGKHSQ